MRKVPFKHWIVWIPSSQLQGKVRDEFLYADVEIRRRILRQAVEKRPLKRRGKPSAPPCLHYRDLLELRIRRRSVFNLGIGALVIRHTEQLIRIDGRGAPVESPDTSRTGFPKSLPWERG